MLNLDPPVGAIWEVVNLAKVLDTSAAVRRAIINLLSSSKGRRVAVVGFVGDGAEAYLPKPTGIELFCWPKAGGTNPNALRRLDRRAVKIRFIDSLHMKVYWAEDRGAVVTSANLSTNALGVGDLKEFGVSLPRGAINIERLLSSMRSRPMTATELRKLDRQHDLFLAQTPDRYVSSSHQIQFKDWLASRIRSRWKLGWWDTYATPSAAAKALVKTEYALREPTWTLTAGKHGYRRGDWVLSLRLGARTLSDIEWMFVDHVVEIPRSDKRSYDKDCPMEAVQVWPLKRYPPPPFRLDLAFRAAFSKAVKEFGFARIEGMRSTEPPARLIKLIAASYQ